MAQTDLSERQKRRLVEEAFRWFRIMRRHSGTQSFEDTVSKLRGASAEGRQAAILDVLQGYENTLVGVHMVVLAASHLYVGLGFLKVDWRGGLREAWDRYSAAYADTEMYDLRNALEHFERDVATRDREPNKTTIGAMAGDGVLRTVALFERTYDLQRLLGAADRLWESLRDASEEELIGEIKV